MSAEQIDLLCKKANHEIKIHINRVAKKQIAAMRQAWGVQS